MTDDAEEAPMLPGLAPIMPAESHLERSARRTINALRKHELVDDRHAVLEQLLLDMSGAVTDGRRSGKASAAAMAAAQLLATIDRLMPKEEGGGIDDEVRRLVEDLREAGRSAALRDPAEPGPSE